MNKLWEAIVEILPISPNLIPLAITVITIAIGAIGVLVISLSSIKFKSISAGDKGKTIIPKETKDELIKAYNKIYSTYNMKAAENMLTENMYYTTKCNVEALKKMGLKKEITYKLDEEVAKIMDQQAINIVMEDGKNDLTIAAIPCDYTETYIDATTDKKLYTNTKKAQLSIGFLKSNQVEKDKDTYCINCGTPMESHGDFFDCPSCKSHYSAENYKWSINSVQVIERSNVLTGFILVGIIGMLLLSTAAAIVNKFVFGLAIVGVNLAAFAGVMAYLVWLNKVISVFKVMAADDPLATRQTFFARITYLVRTLELARDFDISKTKAFMESDIYEKIKDANKYDDYFLVDFELKNGVLSNYRTEGDFRHVDVKLKLDQLILHTGKKKKIKKKTKKLNYAVKKHVDAKTEVNESIKIITCKNCGATINLTLNGKCKYCGDNYDIAEHDWVLTKAPVELTK